jgi:hypothetical protein
MLSCVTGVQTCALPICTLIELHNFRIDEMKKDIINIHEKYDREKIRMFLHAHYIELDISHNIALCI